MPDYDHGFKIAAHSSGAGLSRLAGIVPDVWEPIGDTLQTTERLADRAFRATRGSETFVVYFEAYTRWVESAPWSVLAKSGLLSERERLPTRSLIFVLLPQGYTSQKGTFKLKIHPEGKTQQVWFEEVPLWTYKPEPWWEKHPGLMALYPLCDHGREASTALAHAAEAIRHQELDSVRRADLLATLAVFGLLKNRKLDVLSIIGREQMRESAFMQQVAEEVKLEQAREYVLQVLRLRFGDDTVTEFKEAISHIQHLEQLNALHQLAVQSRRISQFRKGMPRP
jgi:hypothetical protein